jgi:hydroxymethylpyrimidine pyrophosphatase-like HAD family hydrolase
MTYIGKEIFTEAPDDKYVAHASFINKMTIHGVSDFLHEIELPLNKCLIVGEPDSLHQLELKMKEEYGHLMGIFRSQPFFIEVVPLHIDKAKT